MDAISVVTFNMGVNNNDHLSTLAFEVILHEGGGRECSRIPGEIALSIGMFNIEPDNIIARMLSTKTRQIISYGYGML